MNFIWSCFARLADYPERHRAMLNTFSLALLTISGVLIGACAHGPVNSDHALAHTSTNSLDWEGTYQGVLPCADCEGIDTTIILDRQMSCRMQTRYLGKDDTLFQRSGNFSWNDAGNTIVMTNTENAPAHYFVGENVLIQLDMNGNRIQGSLAEQYILTKTDSGNNARRSDLSLNGRWQLIELMGKSVNINPESNRLPEIIFDPDNYTISGFGGCNSFSGGYQITADNHITFSNIATTLMWCENMAVEQEFYIVLEISANYSNTDYILSLNSAKMTPLVKFIDISHE